MRIGALRHKVVIRCLDPTAGEDEYGDPNPEWVTVCTPWASIEPLRGRELFTAQQAASEVTSRIRIRYREGITTDMEVVHQNGGKETVYQILYIINPDIRNKELHLMVKEMPAA